MILSVEVCVRCEVKFRRLCVQFYGVAVFIEFRYFISSLLHFIVKFNCIWRGHSVKNVMYFLVPFMKVFSGGVKSGDKPETIIKRFHIVAIAN